MASPTIVQRMNALQETIDRADAAVFAIQKDWDIFKEMESILYGLPGQGEEMRHYQSLSKLRRREKSAYSRIKQHYFQQLCGLFESYEASQRTATIQMRTYDAFRRAATERALAYQAFKEAANAQAWVIIDFVDELPKVKEWYQKILQLQTGLEDLLERDESTGTVEGHAMTDPLAGVGTGPEQVPLLYTPISNESSHTPITQPDSTSIAPLPSLNPPPNITLLGLVPSFPYPSLASIPTNIQSAPPAQFLDEEFEAEALDWKGS